MGSKVCKFGGTSVADAPQLRRVKAIIEADAERRWVVVSAPGRRSDSDQKVTDLLYLCREHARRGLAFDEVFRVLQERFVSIVRELQLDLDIVRELDEVRRQIAAGASEDYTASRGEYLHAQVVAAWLGYDFVDAASLIRFDEHGVYLPERTIERVAAQLAEHRKAVVPGFYGSDPRGEVRTFSRGGSDITGAIIARAVGADVYENWTDVSGLMMADPKIVPDPKPITRLTYRELRELAYMGATVLHDEAIFPVRESGIPVNIRNTNRPDDPGTLIVSDSADLPVTGHITGVAGHKGFTILAIEKTLMNAEVGFGRRVLSVLERHQLNFEHMPSGIDTLSVIIDSDHLDGVLDQLVEEIKLECKPDNIHVHPGIALIATVGRGMMHVPGMAAKVMTALAEAGVNIRMIDQGSGELNIIVGVQDADFEAAVRALYTAFSS